MKETFNNYWNNFKKQPDIWLFFGFIFTFPLSIRKVTLFFPIQQTFNEYTGIYLYASDIAFLLVLISFCFSILKNNRAYLSRYKLWANQLINNLYLFIPAILVTISFLSIIWSQNQTIALYKSTRLFGVYLIYLYTVIRFIPRLLFHVEHSKKNKAYQQQQDGIVPRGTILKSIDLVRHCSTWNNFLKIIILSGLLQSMIAIWQFITQHSIGLFWLKESSISQNTIGVAKIILHGQHYIRAYGLFPHPNILGGFLLFSIITTLLYKKTFYANCSTWNNFKTYTINQSPNHSSETQIVPRGTFYMPSGDNKSYFSFQKLAIKKVWLIYSILWIQVIALFLTFSKSAIIGLLISLAYIKLFHVEQLKKIILTGLILLALIFVLKPDLNALFIQSLEERVFYLNVLRGTILANPITGIGAGQFVLNIQEYSRKAVEIWQFQPVHNIYLEMWSELGIVSLGLFLWMTWKLFHVEQFNKNKPPQQFQGSNVPRGTSQKNNIDKKDEIEIGDDMRDTSILCNSYNILSIETTLRYFQGILLGFLFIGLFDHYFWDIWPGQVLFWLIIGTIAGIKQKEIHNARSKV